LDLVAFTFQVRAHLVEYQPVIPTNNPANILAHDPPWFDLSNCSKHVRPEVALVIFTESASCDRVWLAGESPCEDVDSSSMRSKRDVCDVFITDCFGEVVLQNSATEGVPLAVEYILPTHPFGSEIKPTYT
jgi:hypothetical protein